MRYNARRQLAPRFQIGRSKFCRHSDAFNRHSGVFKPSFRRKPEPDLWGATAAPGQPGFCPITGLPLGEDGHQAVADTVTGATGSYTLQAVTYPSAVQYSDDGNYLPAGDGRAYVRTCGAYRNALTFRNPSSSERIFSSTAMPVSASLKGILPTEVYRIPTSTLYPASVCARPGKFLRRPGQSSSW